MLLKRIHVVKLWKFCFSKIRHYMMFKYAKKRENDREKSVPSQAVPPQETRVYQETHFDSVDDTGM